MIKTLILLINNDDIDSILEGLDYIQSNNLTSYGVMLINNGSIDGDELKKIHADYKLVKDYIDSPERYENEVVLNQLRVSVMKHNVDNVFIVTNNHKRILMYLPILKSLYETNPNSVLGVYGGSLLSSFFPSVEIFQNDLGTDWVGINGMLINTNLWKKEVNLFDLEYYIEYFMIDLGKRLKDKGYKLYKLHPFKFNDKSSLIDYFRQRNPYLYLRKFGGTFRYVIGFMLFLVKMFGLIFGGINNEKLIQGNLDGIKLLIMNPRNTS